MNWVNVRKARKPHRCAHCREIIPPGAQYLHHTCTPDHDGLGNVGWWREAECATCAYRRDRGHLFEPIPVKPCPGPAHCINDLCRTADQGICGVWRDDAADDEADDEYPAEVPA